MSRVATLLAPLVFAACAAEPRLESVIGEAAQSVVSISDGTSTIGSAFAVAADGWLVTNAHVAGTHGARYLVRRDGSLQALERGAADPDGDVALLRAPGAVLAPLAFRDHRPAVGETVLALGNPFGLGITASRGIVSALPDAIGNPLLQTDAAVNAGNSGGPLLDRYGRVLGMVTSRGAVGSGIGFAVPAERIRNLLRDALP